MREVSSETMTWPRGAAPEARRGRGRALRRFAARVGASLGESSSAGRGEVFRLSRRIGVVL
jgi:hypothetical protein